MRLARIAAAVLVVALGRGRLRPQLRHARSASAPRPTTGAKGTETTAAQDLGFPTFATKNTTRIGGADAIADAAAAARAVYTATSQITRPQAVVLADDGDWRVGLAASVLMSAPIRAPLLYAHGADKLPPATQNALTALAPKGSKDAGRRAGHPRRQRARARRHQDHRLARRWRLRARPRHRRLPGRRARDHERPRHRRRRRRAGVRDARRGVGGQGRRPHPLHPPRQHPRGHARRDRRPPAAEDLRPRTAQRRLRQDA